MRRGCILALAVFGARVVGAQAANGLVVDQGSFTITVGSTREGRETFAIRRSPAGGVDAPFQATGTVLLTDRRLTPALTTDASGGPITYTLEVRGGSAPIERMAVSRDRGFLTLRGQWPGEESVREIPTAPVRWGPDSAAIGGTVLVDDDVVHHYYFLLLRRREGTVSVVVPRRQAAVALHIARDGADSVVIGNHILKAERVSITGDADGERLVWVDAAGRVLKVEAPDRHLLALRDDPPR